MRTRRDIIVAVLSVVMIVLTAGAVSESNRDAMFRQRCASNLSSLGKAVQVYANDYLDEFPKAGFRRNEWAPTLPNWAGRHRQEAYGMTRDRSDYVGKVTATSSLYLLVKYEEAKMDWFVCPGEPDTTPFDLRRVPEELPGGFEFIDAWDFGGRYNARDNPSTHCSYAYHIPFGRYALIPANDLRMAVMADRNPWMDPNRVADPNAGWARFDPSAPDSDETRIGNSDAHERAGQNVLFADSHVRFQKRPTCGIDNDNIYTLASDTTEAGRAKGRRPQVYDPTQPLNHRDSMLVQEVAYDIASSAPEAPEEGR
jgi:hypothetical protein